jgi:hypothetical protein
MNSIPRVFGKGGRGLKKLLGSMILGRGRRNMRKGRVEGGRGGGKKKRVRDKGGGGG